MNTSGDAGKVVFRRIGGRVIPMRYKLAGAGAAIAIYPHLRGTYIHPAEERPRVSKFAPTVIGAGLIAAGYPKQTFRAARKAFSWVRAHSAKVKAANAAKQAARAAGGFL